MLFDKINCNFNYFLLVFGVFIIITVFAIPKQKKPLITIPIDNKTTERPRRRKQYHFDMQHYEQSTELDHYMDNIDLLLEPSSCDKVKRIVVMVMSRPSNVENRLAIRKTWGRKLPPFFLLGVEDYINEGDKLPAYIYEEATEFDDLIVYNVWEHYQNLTIKSMFMIKWTLEQCPKFELYLKTDDDIFVNPWVLNKVVRDHQNSDLIGHKRSEQLLDRCNDSKYFVPRWIEPLTIVSEFLLGSGYIINGKHLSAIYETARSVPLMNLEDVYVTYLVAKRGLGLNLTNDYRMDAYMTRSIFYRAYWQKAVSHEFQPKAMYAAWMLLSKKNRRLPEMLEMLA